MEDLFYTREEVRKIDDIAINKYKIPSYSLMQKAGDFVFSKIQQYWPMKKQLLVFCGNGNNAGDGFIVAKLAIENSWKVLIVLCCSDTELKGDAKRAYLECKAKHANILSFQDFKLSNFDSKSNQNSETGSHVDYEIIVDALFGTGLNKSLNNKWQAIINCINSLSACKISIDIPSGLNANTGCPMPVAIKADITATFIGLKQGLFTGYARDYCGLIEFSNLNVEKDVYKEVSSSGSLIFSQKLKSALLKKSNSAHKGNFGHLCIIGGNIGMMGAAILAAQGALRSGTGLVTVLTRKEHANLIPLATPEIMSKGIDDLAEAENIIDKSDAILIGPGLGRDSWADNLFKQAVKLEKKLIIDADGLNLLSEYKSIKLKNAILTPHPGEASKLLKIDTKSVQEDRFKACKDLNNKYSSVIVLKGAGTIVFGTDKKYYITNAGNVGMASGGMGDILAGIIAGLSVQNLDLDMSAKIGVSVHSQAGDQEIIKGKQGMIATDLLPWVRLLLD